MNRVQLIVLAAGKGTRMQSTLPKVLQLAGHQTMIEHVLDAIEASQSDRAPILVVGFLGGLVREVCGERAEYCVQEEQLGTGHAVSCARNILSGNTDTVFVIYGDHPLLSAVTINQLLDEHHAKGNMLTLATTFARGDFSKSFAGFSRILRNSEGSISGSVEVKDATEQHLLIDEVNPAYLVFDKDWMFEKLATLDNKNAQGEYYLTDLIGLAFAEDHPIADIQIPAHEALGANTRDQVRFLENYI
jgi:bifunctional UDP-N-acetylglucosamine pyrophosphorylase/glucosamine-1-phosphate N-acetyltransferase